MRLSIFHDILKCPQHHTTEYLIIYSHVENLTMYMSAGQVKHQQEDQNFSLELSSSSSFFCNFLLWLGAQQLLDYSQWAYITWSKIAKITLLFYSIKRDCIFKRGMNRES